MATAPTLRNVPSRLAGPPRRPRETSLTLFPTAACPGTRESADGNSPAVPAPGRTDAPAAELVGIARLAASSPLANEKRGTEYFLLPVRSILNQCSSERVPFRWTVNPYRGCEFGCKYCYARYTHEYMELDGGEFERKIYVKKDPGPLIARDLETEKIWGEHIAIGAATDPYQPAEREFHVTRVVLEEMSKREGLSLSITTKSDKVAEDIELLKKISARSSLTVNMSVTTMRTHLARLLEPRAPRPDLRLEAVRKLRHAGIAAGVFAMPVLPGITDSEKDLDDLARAAKGADALWFAASALFLMSSSLKQFLPFLAKEFPKLARRYRELYGRGGYAPEGYRQELAKLVDSLRRKHGLATRPPVPAERAWHSPQLPLALAAATP